MDSNELVGLDIGIDDHGTIASSHGFIPSPHVIHGYSNMMPLVSIIFGPVRLQSSYPSP